MSHLLLFSTQSFAKYTQSIAKIFSLSFAQLCVYLAKLCVAIALRRLPDQFHQPRNSQVRDQSPVNATGVTGNYAEKDSTKK
jgi:hypothetical protein